MKTQKNFTARDFLLQEFEKRKENHDLYPLRAFARDIELSPSRTSEFLRGQRSISQEQGEKLAETLSLSPDTREQFLRLVKDSLRARSKTRTLEPHLETVPLDLFCGHWQVDSRIKEQGYSDDDKFEAELEISLINDGADLDCFYLYENGTRTKNFSTLPENLIKTHGDYDDTVRIRTIHESRFLHDRLVIVSIFKSIGVDSVIESMISSATTEIFPLENERLRYRRQGHTVETKEGSILSALFEIELILDRK